jgi:hypothetical protein
MLPAVAETLKGEESHALAEVEIFVGKQVRYKLNRSIIKSSSMSL